MLILNKVGRLCKQCLAWLHAALLAPEDLEHDATPRGRAQQRALSLLLNLLNDEQRDEFQTKGFFHATGGSSGDRYRIRVDSAVNIDVLGRDGTVRHHLCARPIGNIPMYDVMAAQLLYLQDRESEPLFLDHANRHATLSFAATMSSRCNNQRP